MKSLLLKYVVYRNLGPDRKSCWPLHDDDRSSAWKAALAEAGSGGASLGEVLDLGFGFGTLGMAALLAGTTAGDTAAAGDAAATGAAPTGAGVTDSRGDPAPVTVVEKLRPVRKIVNKLVEANDSEGLLAGRVRVVDGLEEAAAGGRRPTAATLIVDIPDGHLLRARDYGMLGQGLVAALQRVGGVRAPDSSDDDDDGGDDDDDDDDAGDGAAAAPASPSPLVPSPCLKRVFPARVRVMAMLVRIDTTQPLPVSGHLSEVRK